MITLFGSLASGNVHKVQLILRFINQPFLRVEVSQAKGETKRPELLKLNPMGKFPVLLLESGDVLSESNAILFYFAKDTRLWPDDTRTQTEVLRWLFFEQYSHEPTLAVIRHLSRYVKDPHKYTKHIQSLKPKARHALLVLEQQLQSHLWLASDRCTVADYALYPYTRTANESGFNLADYPAIEKWLSQVEAQPNFLPMGVEGAQNVQGFYEYFQGNRP
ncbi:glutathione S-transferase family protein [Acaryochloris sp. IP29b_bin.148]|uniref:glutathione S-transferase family protein n=1 Tax=Acaryochloris sp. IP29b_bin.148 TaxID=2969218 RepID=UPI002614119E|nr:glutathione S-transferase family protein [Acaryochloris sp. IP29b_bin.148]